MNTESSIESRLTVILRSPAAASASAFLARSEPLVVRVRSVSPSIDPSEPISSSIPRLRSGSPPVSRTLVAPCEANTVATLVISENDRS
jgi:3-methyladenine DNA glycosylase AlkC